MKTLLGTTALAAALAIGAPGLALAQTQTTGTQTTGTNGSHVQVQEPAPHVTVHQPQPNVTVQQPKPNVVVQQPKPQVTVQEPQPKVTVQTAKPSVTLHEAKPNVAVERSGKPNVNVNRTGQSQVIVKHPSGTQNQTGSLQTGSQATQKTAHNNQTSANQGVALASVKKLVGTKVVTANGKTTGQVQNLLVGADNRVRAAVVQWGGGIFGVGQSEAVVPIQHIHLASNGNKARMDLTQQQLKALPHYDKNKLNEYASRNGWGSNVRLYR